MAKKNVPTQQKNKAIPKLKDSKASLSEQKITLEKFRRMATVIQDSNDAITFQDLEGNILAWNRGAEKMYGYSEAEALNMNIVDTVPDEYQEEARQFIASLKRGELVPNLETKRKHQNGEIIDVWLTNTKLTDDKGKLTGIATTERDITERKQHEASLKEKFRELDYLREGQIALSESMRGQQDLSRLGQSILSHLVPFTNAQIGAFYLVSGDKTLKRISGYALPEMEGTEKPVKFGVGLIGQVALEKRTLLIEDVPAGYFNKIQSTFGELIPRSLLICPILYENEVNGVIELGSLYPFTEHQRAFLSHVSANIGIAINTSDVRNKVQELLEQSQTLNDKLQTQQEELNKAQVLLEEKATEVQRGSQYKTEFLANMSHELRTPLNSSLILAKLLMDNAKGNLTEDQIKYASSIYSSGNDLLNLINDILDLSKVEAGKLDIRVEDVFLSRVIDGLKQTFQTLAHEKTVNFEVTCENNLPQFFQTDRQRLDQILKNLISNAFKFTQVGSVKVRIFHHSNEHLGFEVTDSGIGIPKEQQEIIFEAFRQADGTTNRKFGGTGLGLSISRDLARLLGGSIKVTSSPGKGSCFTLILPEFYNEELIATTPSKLYSAHSVSILEKDKVKQRNFEKIMSPPFEDDRSDDVKSGPTILVIEDEPQFSRILFDLAHELQYKCLVAQGADEGFEMAIEYKPDAIVLDMRLPDHLGLVTLDRLKKDPSTRHIPVHVISVEDYTEVALRMGAIGYMFKPAKREELKNVFEKLEAKFSQDIHQVLIVEENEFQIKNICHLLSDEGIKFTKVATAAEAVIALKDNAFDCMIMNPNLPDMSAEQVLSQIMHANITSIPPVIIYNGSPISREQEEKIRHHSQSITVKTAGSSEKLLNEVTLFLHQPESEMSPARRLMLKNNRGLEQSFEGVKILLVDDDIRNIFALTSALEQQGATIVIGRNGYEALDKLEQDSKIDLVLMDVMMPEMDGLEATRRIRKQKKFDNLPIIAVTAKAMKEDQMICLQAGASDYLSKPVNLEKLFSILRVWAP
ncbi:response regulator [Bacteriovorax sp. PP10]|uniref:histidine kinase n=1 Tax=Bacteriovorax antarcticus TaxID=3088717 RepID=A0ABU5VXM8_9BACT|nr:response regulator [Bacteriovorax sp. PP10]MEA9357801.1 response regulator [Bacteriovorax sp. PP10]